jgi:hypothetical protein
VFFRPSELPEEPEEDEEDEEDDEDDEDDWPSGLRPFMEAILLPPARPFVGELPRDFRREAASRVVPCLPLELPAESEL